VKRQARVSPPPSLSFDRLRTPPRSGGGVDHSSILRLYTHRHPPRQQCQIRRLGRRRRSICIHPFSVGAASTQRPRPVGFFRQPSEGKGYVLCAGRTQPTTSRVPFWEAARITCLCPRFCGRFPEGEQTSLRPTPSYNSPSSPSPSQNPLPASPVPGEESIIR